MWNNSQTIFENPTCLSQQPCSPWFNRLARQDLYLPSLANSISTLDSLGFSQPTGLDQESTDALVTSFLHTSPQNTLPSSQLSSSAFSMDFPLTSLGSFPDLSFLHSTNSSLTLPIPNQPLPSLSSSAFSSFPLQPFSSTSSSTASISQLNLSFPNSSFAYATSFGHAGEQIDTVDILSSSQTMES
jgi:hypothetical protein